MVPVITVSIILQKHTFLTHTMWLNIVNTYIKIRILKTHSGKSFHNAYNIITENNIFH